MRAIFARNVYVAFTKPSHSCCQLRRSCAWFFRMEFADVDCGSWWKILADGFDFFFFSNSIHKTGPSNFLQLQSLHHIAHFIGLLTAYKIRVMPLVDFSGAAWPVSWPSAAMPCSAAESTGPRQQVWEAWGHPAGRRRPQSSRRARRHLAGNGGQQRGAWRTSEASRAIQTVHRAAEARWCSQQLRQRQCDRGHVNL